MHVYNNLEHLFGEYNDGNFPPVGRALRPSLGAVCTGEGVMLSGRWERLEAPCRGHPTPTRHVNDAGAVGTGTGGGVGEGNPKVPREGEPSREAAERGPKGGELRQGNGPGLLPPAGTRRRPGSSIATLPPMTAWRLAISIILLCLTSITHHHTTTVTIIIRTTVIAILIIATPTHGKKPDGVVGAHNILSPGTSRPIRHLGQPSRLNPLLTDLPCLRVSMQILGAGGSSQLDPTPPPLGERGPAQRLKKIGVVPAEQKDSKASQLNIFPPDGRRVSEVTRRLLDGFKCAGWTPTPPLPRRGEGLQGFVRKLPKRPPAAGAPPPPLTTPGGFIESKGREAVWGLEGNLRGESFAEVHDADQAVDARQRGEGGKVACTGSDCEGHSGWEGMHTFRAHGENFEKPGSQDVKGEKIFFIIRSFRFGDKHKRKRSGYNYKMELPQN